MILSAQADDPPAKGWSFIGKFHSEKGNTIPGKFFESLFMRRKSITLVYMRKYKFLDSNFPGISENS